MPTCPQCHSESPEQARFCQGCGASLTASADATSPRAGTSTPDTAEQSLYRFGPLGVGICWARPSLWAWTKYNMVEVVLTNTRLCGVWNPAFLRMLFSRRRGQVYFQIMRTNILGVELTHLAANKVVVVRYREGASEKVLSIEAALGCHHHAERLAELLSS